MASRPILRSLIVCTYLIEFKEDELRYAIYVARRLDLGWKSSFTTHFIPNRAVPMVEVTLNKDQTALLVSDITTHREALDIALQTFQHEFTVYEKVHATLHEGEKDNGTS